MKRHIYIKIVILLVLVAVAVLINEFIGFYYDINDDITLQQLASGYFTGVPDGHFCQFINFFYGNIIAYLFKKLPQIDWYGTALIALNFLCYVLIIIRIYDITKFSKSKLDIRIISGLILLMLFLETTILFQFTIVSGTLAATVLFLLITLQPEQVNIGNYCVIWVLYLISAMLRGKMFFMILPLFILVLSYYFYKICKIKKKPKENYKKIVLFLAITVVGILLNIVLSQFENQVYSSDKKWRDYSEYNHARSVITDYYDWPLYEGNEEFWNSIDITKEEYDCLIVFGILPDIDTNKIKMIAEYSQSISEEENITDKLDRMKHLFGAAVKFEKCRTSNVMFVLMSVILIIYLIKSDRIHKMFIGTGIFIQVGIFLYLLYEGRLPDRIVIVYTYQCILVILGIGVNYFKENEIDCKDKWGYWGIATVLALLLTFAINNTVTSVSLYKNQLNIYNEVRQYITSNSENVYFATLGTINAKKQYTFFDDKEKVKWFGCYGWSSKSPWYNACFSELGIDYKSHILFEENVYLITNYLLYADNLDAFYNSEKLLEKDYEITDTIILSDGTYIFVVNYRI